jgi:opacity protein-like surface antigen
MRYLLWGTAAALLAATSTSAGERSWYASLEVGFSDTSVDARYDVVFVTPALPGSAYPFGVMGDADETLTFLAAIGTRITEGLRLEIEVARRSAEGIGIEASQHTLMLNAAYDIPIVDRLSVTIGAGGGIDFVSVDTLVGGSHSDSPLAYQGLIGLTYEVASGTDLTVTYRHFDTIDANISESAPGGYVSLSSADDQTLSIGLRFDL